MKPQLVYNAETCEYEPFHASQEKYGPARTKQESSKVKLYEYLMFGIIKRGSVTNSIVLNTDLIELIKTFSIGTQRDIDFLCKTIIDSREKWSIRNSISILALVILSTSSKQYSRDKFNQIFLKVVKSDQDLIEFMEYIKTNSIRGFGKVIQKSIQSWFNNLSPYEALKYNKQNSRTIRQYSSGTIYTVADIIRLAHVKPKDEEQSALYKWILTGEVSEKLHGSIKAAEWYKKQNTLSPQKREITEKNNIPIEILKPVKSPIDAYYNIFQQLSFDDLLKNFTFLAKKGVFKDSNITKRTSNILKSKKTIEISGVLPHQLLELYDQNTTENASILSSLEEAAENAYVNLPKINKSITIFVDKSDVAKKTFATENTQVSLHYTFATFSAILSKLADDVDIYTFSNDVIKQNFDKTKSTMQISDTIIDTKRTATSVDEQALFEFLKTSTINSDIIILFSANSRWDDILRETAGGSCLTEYIRKVNKPHQRFIFVNSTPQTQMYEHSLELADFIHGWNDRNLKYLLYLLQIDSTTIDDII